MWCPCVSDPVGNIIENMTTKRSRAKVIEKLLDMGAVTDKKELYKKRKGGVGSGQNRKGRKERRNEWEEEEEEREMEEGRSDMEGRGDIVSVVL